jgi:hypothetical protein
VAGGGQRARERLDIGVLEHDAAVARHVEDKVGEELAREQRRQTAVAGLEFARGDDPRLGRRSATGRPAPEISSVRSRPATPAALSDSALAFISHSGAS